MAGCSGNPCSAPSTFPLPKPRALSVKQGNFCQGFDKGKATGDQFPENGAGDQGNGWMLWKPLLCPFHFPLAKAATPQRETGEFLSGL